MLPSGTLNRDIVLDGSGLNGQPMILDYDLYVPTSTTLTIEPGTTFAFNITNVWLRVQGGTLIAEGTAAQPITFTATYTDSRPGLWRMIGVEAQGMARLDYCTINSAGLAGSAALWIAAANAQVHHCTIHGNQGDGIQVDGDAHPSLTYNSVYDNGFGVRNNSTRIFVDARYTYWGDPSGPYQLTSNPGGKGNGVSDRVLYAPWAEDATGTLTSQVGLQIFGPTRASPGDTVEYALYYVNQLTSTIENSVLVLSLPQTVEYLDSTAGGIYWPERHQVFWRPGSLAAGAEDTVSVRVRYFWRLRDSMTSRAMAILAGSNWGSLDIAPRIICGDRASPPSA